MSESADFENPDRAGRPDPLLAGMLLLGAAVVFGAVAFLMLTGGRASVEEVTYIIKSLWYAGGDNFPRVQPYTAIDATAKMPLYFYQLGFWQQVESAGLISARLLSVGLGVVNGALLFIICRRLTANTLVAAAAVLIFLGTPATAYYFATATPAAMASALLLLAVWMIVANMGRQRPAVSLLMGAVCAALYFTRQNMLLGVVVLVPLYVAAIGRKRALHAVLVVIGIAAVTGALLYAFPAKFGEYALRLPLVSPLLESLGLLAPNFTLIDRGTTGTLTMGPAFDRISPVDVLDSFVLPYAGTLVLSLLLFKFARGPLRVLWIAPLFFIWLAASHYLASLGYCQGCIYSYAPYFSAIGALAAALSLAMIAHWARQNAVPAAPMVMVGALLAVGLNTFAPMLAWRTEHKFLPIPLMVSATPENRDVEAMARWISANAPPREPILVLHSLGRQTIPSLPYAVFLSEHNIPAQSIDPAGTRRVVNPKLAGPAREAVQAALEEESLWSDETFNRWIGRDFEIVLFHEDRSIDQRAQIAAIAKRFDLAATTTYRGATIRLYRSKAQQ